jgi:hypothetical protein
MPYLRPMGSEPHCALGGSPRQERGTDPRRMRSDALLHQLLGHGRERGFARAQVSVFIGNERARRAYIKAGFEPLAEQRSDAWQQEFSCPGTEMLLQSL